MSDRWRMCWKKKNGLGREEHTVYFYTVESDAERDARKMNEMFPDTKYWIEQEPKRAEWSGLER